MTEEIRDGERSRPDFGRVALAQYRSAPRRAGGRGGRTSARPANLLLRGVAGGVWKTTTAARTGRTSPTASSRPRRSARSPCRDSDPERHLRRHGRERRSAATSRTATASTSPPTAGKTWTQRRAGGHAPHRQDPRPPAPTPTSSTSRRWPRLGPERGARRLPLDRRRRRPGSRCSSGASEPARIDLAMDPHNPRILYAALWEAQRYPCSARQRRPGVRHLASRPTAATPGPRSRATPACRKGVLGQDRRRRLAGASRPRLGAGRGRRTAALFRSDDGGETWQRAQRGRRAAPAPLVLHAHLRRPAGRRHRLGAEPRTAGSRSTAARPSTTVPTPHGDNHDLWIDPHELAADDRGQRRRRVRHASTAARSWSTHLQPADRAVLPCRRPTTRCRTASTARSRTTGRSACRASRSRARSPGRTGVEPGGGESGYIAVRPTTRTSSSAAAIGSGAGHGRLHRATTTAPGRSATSPSGPRSTAWARAPRTLKYRFQWTFPIVLSPHDPNVLYIAGNRVLRSTDEGTSWEVDQPGPDAQRPDASSGPRAGRSPRDNTGAEIYCTIFAFARVAARTGVLLGRLRRRPGPHLARRRADLAERHAAATCRSGR